ARTGQRARLPSRRFSRRTVTTLLQLENGISHQTRSRGLRALLTAGRTRLASTISGDFSAETPVSSIRFSLRELKSLASRRRRTSILTMQWQTIRLRGSAIKKRRHQENPFFTI